MGFCIQTEGGLELGSVGECVGHVIFGLKGKEHIFSAVMESFH